MKSVAVLFALPLGLSADSANQPTPTLEIVDFGQNLAVKAEWKDQAKSEWRASFSLDLKVTKNATTDFEFAKREDMKLESLDVQTVSSKDVPNDAPTLYRRATFHLTGTAKLPAQVTMIHPLIEKPIRFTVPAATIVIPDGAVDLIVLGSLAASAILVVTGAILSQKSSWLDMGTQQWTFDSWATNTAVAGGVGALVLKLIPGADVPYTQVSAILGLTASLAPTAYNLTTRSENGTQKGKVLFFILSAILTGGSVFGQLQIAFRVLQVTPSQIAPAALIAIDVVVFAVAAAFVFHLLISVRDTIIAQTTPDAAASPLHRIALPAAGTGFTAL